MDSRKKIFIAINKFSIGGAETVVLNQANLLDRNKFDVFVGILHESSDDNTLFDRLELPADRIIRFSLPKRALWNVTSWYKVYSFLRRQNMGIVVTNLFETNTIVRTIAIFVRVPTIVMVEHSHFTRRWWQRAVNRLLAHFTDIIFGVSKEVVDFIKEQEHISEEKLHVLPTVVDLRLRGEFVRETLRMELGIPLNAFVCVTVGRFNPEKAQQKILQIARILKDKNYDQIYFIIAGYGFLETSLKKSAIKLGIADKVTIIADARKAREYMVAGDVFLLTSEREGLGIVILEAMYNGLVPIASSVGGVPSIIKHAHNGFLVSPDDIDVFADRIILLLNDGTIHADMKSAAFKSAKEHLGKITDFEKILLKTSN